MSCPTCGHAMECLSLVLTRGPYWCPRCGTIGSLSPEDNPQWHVPKLVDRCREMEKALGPEWVAQCGHLKTKWKQLGIAESIHKPEDRK